MKIILTTGIGEGDTKLSAFDAALWDAGIANSNLITLSSIIPPNSVIVSDKTTLNNENFGDRLYVVLAQKRESDVGREAWAGIGWVQSDDGRGLFVEHSGSQKAEVVRQIKESLNDMTKYRKEKYGIINYQVAGIQCRIRSVCAVVAAIYGVEEWPLN